jgi:hypothetical protein
MTPLNGFEMQYVGAPDHYHLLRHGKVWKAPCDGALLLGAWAVHGLILVMTQDNDGYEDMLHLSLMGTTGEVMEDVTIGVLYENGQAQNILVTGPDRLALTFPFPPIQWQITVLPKPKWCIPWPGNWSAVWRINSPWRTQLQCRYFRR